MVKNIICKLVDKVRCLQISVCNTYTLHLEPSLCVYSRISRGKRQDTSSHSGREITRDLLDVPQLLECAIHNKYQLNEYGRYFIRLTKPAITKFGKNYSASFPPYYLEEGRPNYLLPTIQQCYLWSVVCQQFQLDGAAITKSKNPQPHEIHSILYLWFSGPKTHRLNVHDWHLKRQFSVSSILLPTIQILDLRAADARKLPDLESSVPIWSQWKNWSMCFLVIFCARTCAVTSRAKRTLACLFHSSTIPLAPTHGLVIIFYY